MQCGMKYDPQEEGKAINKKFKVYIDIIGSMKTLQL